MKKLYLHVEAVLQSEYEYLMEELIGNKNKQEFDDLIAVVDSDSMPSDDKAKVLYALARWCDKTAVPVIAKALTDLSEVCRVSAVDALSRLESKQSLETIMALSKDESTYVRKFVAQSLVKLKKAEASTLLKSMKAKEKVDFLRQAIE
ncbi:MAG: HEAT repeat protein [Cellvibrionaceae bacterium]|jgi:HEAT repeat protein